MKRTVLLAASVLTTLSLSGCFTIAEYLKPWSAGAWQDTLTRVKDARSLIDAEEPKDAEAYRRLLDLAEREATIRIAIGALEQVKSGGKRIDRSAVSRLLSQFGSFEEAYAQARELPVAVRRELIDAGVVPDRRAVDIAEAVYRIGIDWLEDEVRDRAAEASDRELIDSMADLRAFRYHHGVTDHVLRGMVVTEVGEDERARREELFLDAVEEAFEPALYSIDDGLVLVEDLLDAFDEQIGSYEKSKNTHARLTNAWEALPAKYQAVSDRFGSYESAEFGYLLTDVKDELDYYESELPDLELRMRRANILMARIENDRSYGHFQDLLQATSEEVRTAERERASARVQSIAESVLRQIHDLEGEIDSYYRDTGDSEIDRIKLTLHERAATAKAYTESSDVEIVHAVREHAEELSKLFAGVAGREVFGIQFKRNGVTQRVLLETGDAPLLVPYVLFINYLFKACSLDVIGNLDSLPPWATERTEIETVVSVLENITGYRNNKSRLVSDLSAIEEDFFTSERANEALGSYFEAYRAGRIEDALVYLRYAFDYERSAPFSEYLAAAAAGSPPDTAAFSEEVERDPDYGRFYAGLLAYLADAESNRTASFLKDVMTGGSILSGEVLHLVTDLRRWSRLGDELYLRVSPMLADVRGNVAGARSALEDFEDSRDARALDVARRHADFAVAELRCSEEYGERPSTARAETLGVDTAIDAETVLYMAARAYGESGEYAAALALCEQGTGDWVEPLRRQLVSARFLEATLRGQSVAEHTTSAELDELVDAASEGVTLQRYGDIARMYEIFGPLSRSIAMVSIAHPRGFERTEQVESDEVTPYQYLGFAAKLNLMNLLFSARSVSDPAFRYARDAIASDESAGDTEITSLLLVMTMKKQRRTGDYREELGRIEEMFLEHRNDRRYRYLMALAYFLADRYGDAKGILEEMRRDQKVDIPVNLLYGRVLKAQDDPLAALEFDTVSVALNQSDPSRWHALPHNPIYYSVVRETTQMESD